MGTFNRLMTTLVCSRCGERTETEVDCYFGDTSSMQYLRIGDAYPWRTSKAPQNGGRPVNGDHFGEAYMQCPVCDGDAHLRVIVRSDVIVAVVVDPDKQPYVHDAALQRSAAPLRWHRFEFVASESRFRDYTIAGELEWVGRSLAVAAADHEAHEIETARTRLARGATWALSHGDKIETFLRRSLNDDQAMDLSFEAFSIDRIVLHRSPEHGAYFAVWCSCSGGTPIGYFSERDFLPFGEAELYW
jgi:hypothetical protein